mmetsp:Transcript_6582/g.15401  ORF Transcript_6582/g.15401 Transcript_6582/m.15401 type:complete len:337 (-) Transcript_6582:97-1107(-)
MLRLLIVAVLCSFSGYTAAQSDEMGDMHDGSGADFEHLMSGGGVHACFVNQSRLVCWGSDELGNTNPPSGEFKAVSAGSWHTCALDSAGKVVCFGSGYALQGDPAPEDELTALSAGFAQSCGVLAKDGSLKCWGYGATVGPPEGTFKHVNVGTRSACAITAGDGKLNCWGSDEFGQVSGAPQDAGFVSVSCGGGHCCGLTQLGQIVCWGGSDPYNMGKSMGTTQERFIQVSSGEDHACGMTSAGAVLCWGRCDTRACDITKHGPFALIAAGSAHTCGVAKYDASLRCWGNIPDVHPGEYTLHVRDGAAKVGDAKEAAGKASSAQTQDTVVDGKTSR